MRNATITSQFVRWTKAMAELDAFGDHYQRLDEAVVQASKDEIAECADGL